MFMLINVETYHVSHVLLLYYKGSNGYVQHSILARQLRGKVSYLNIVSNIFIKANNYIYIHILYSFFGESISLISPEK